MPSSPPPPSTPDIASLERELTETKARLAVLEEESWLMRLELDVSQETLTVFEDGVVVDVNPQFEVMFRGKREEAIGKRAIEFVAPESLELVARHQRMGFDEPYEATLVRMDGTTFVARIRGKNVKHGERTVRVSAFTDMTAQKLADQAIREAAVRDETIRLQEELLAALSTPLLPIAEGALVLPLIGPISESRAASVLDALTAGVSRHGARVAILDVTGVTALDAPALHLIVSATRAASLLGARVLLTGVRADVARMLVDHGHDLGDLRTFATLERGVAFALSRAARGA